MTFNLPGRQKRSDSLTNHNINVLNNVNYFNVHYQNMNINDLLNMLKETKSLHDEADILHYLYENK